MLQVRRRGRGQSCGGRLRVLVLLLWYRRVWRRLWWLLATVRRLRIHVRCAVQSIWNSARSAASNCIRAEIGIRFKGSCFALSASALLPSLTAGYGLARLHFGRSHGH